MRLVDLSTQHVISFFVLFCRAGTPFMFMPGTSEMYINTNVKVALALTTCVMLYSTIDIALPGSIESPLYFLLLILGEILIGASIGITAKLLFSAIHTLGLTIASNIGLASAMMMDPAQGSQGSIIGNFLSIIFTAFLFSTNMHYLVIKILAGSYAQFQIGGFWLYYDDFVTLIVKTTNVAWATGIKLSAPFIAVALLVYVCSGVLSRLMPQFQIFFLILPAQILIGIFILASTLGGIMLWFIEYYEETLVQYFNYV